jgi:hypothetical protein
MPEVNITINIDGEGQVTDTGIKKTVKKKKHGKETILQLPQETEMPKRPQILDIIGV